MALDGGESVTKAGSTLGFALLSLLTRGPATGYQLTQRMKAPIGHFWSAKHSQIYPELARLLAIGWVEVVAGAGPGPRAKKTYTLTEAGRAALQQWLVVPPVPQPRSEMTLKAYAVTEADPAQMAALYQTIADKAEASLVEYRAEATLMRGDGCDSPTHPRFGNYAVLLMGIDSAACTQRWASWLAHSLQTGHPVAYP